MHIFRQHRLVAKYLNDPRGFVTDMRNNALPTCQYHRDKQPVAPWPHARAMKKDEPLVLVITHRERDDAWPMEWKERATRIEVIDENARVVAILKNSNGPAFDSRQAKIAA